MVITPINPTKTHSLLSHFNILNEWSHIINGLVHGFNISINMLPQQTIIYPNHASSLINPNFISAYIAAEEAAGHYLQAFCPEDLEALIGPFCTSPIGPVPKPGSSKLQMIQDLSFPCNDPSTPSVNSLIDPDAFPTAWSSFKATTKLILALPPGCQAATFDISSAYCLTPI
jgi:hypothetical protein